MDHGASHELDRATLERARQGDSQAFAHLVQHYQTPVYNLAYRMLGSRVEAEDAAQETFLRAYAQFKSYRTGSSFTTWLLSIAAHFCIDRLRRRRRFLWISLDDGPFGENLPASNTGPEEAALASDQAENVQRLVQKLPPAHRAVVVLKYWNDFSVEEIAQATGDTVGAVKVKLFRARQAMAREMQKQARLEGTAPHVFERAVGNVR